MPTRKAVPENRPTRSAAVGCGSLSAGGSLISSANSVRHDHWPIGVTTGGASPAPTTAARDRYQRLVSRRTNSAVPMTMNTTNISASAATFVTGFSSTTRLYSGVPVKTAPRARSIT